MGSVRLGGVMVMVSPAGVCVVVAVVRVPAPCVMSGRLRSSQPEQTHREQPSQKDGGYQPAPLMSSESSSHFVSVSENR
jgi:hypothetical protein